MGCTIPQERFTQLVDETVVTSPIVTIPNRNGSNLIALGALDQMGIVELRPRVSNFSTNFKILVSARAPFVGHLDGPIDVYQYWKYDVANYPIATRPLLDIVSFEQIPPIAPTRAAINYAVTTVLDGSGNGAANLVFKVSGRRFIRVVRKNQTSTRIPDASSTVYALGVSGGTGTAALISLDTHASTSSAAKCEFSSNAQWNSAATLPPPGFGTIDYIAVQIVAGTAGETWAIDVQAWD